MSKKISIAIDGPAAAGKSTIAKMVAKNLNYTYIDTGAMYRCVAYYALLKNVDVTDEQAVSMLLKDIDIRMFPDGTIQLNREDVTSAIRENEVSMGASVVSQYGAVRSFLVEKQREMAQGGGVILDGRDIGTVVLKDAELNTYLNGEYLEGLSDADKIVVHNFGVGAVTSGNNDLAGQIMSENGIVWNGKIGLITVSEYLRANTNTTQCEIFSLYNSNYSTCKDTNWMFNSDYWWTLSPYSGSTSNNVWQVYSNGYLRNRYAIGSNGVRPVVTLKPDVKIVSGDGSENNAYQLN